MELPEKLSDVAVVVRPRTAEAGGSTPTSTGVYVQALLVSTASLSQPGSIYSFALPLTPAAQGHRVDCVASAIVAMRACVGGGCVVACGLDGTVVSDNCLFLILYTLQQSMQMNYCRERTAITTPRGI